MCMRQLIAARKAGASVLLISEDLDEMLSLSDRVAVMYRGQHVGAGRRGPTVTIERLGLMMAGHGFAQERRPCGLNRASSRRWS